MFEKVQKSQISLDSQGLATWEINVTGDIGGTYQGLFKFKTVLSPLQQIEADRDYRELLGKNAELVSSHVDNRAYSLSQLKQRVIQAPPFWNDGASRFPGGHIRDENVIQAIYEAAVLAEVMFRDSLKEKHKESLERVKSMLESKVDEAQLEKELEEMDKKKKPKKGAKAKE